jgi:hypothetical protein
MRNAPCMKSAALLWVICCRIWHQV